MPRISETRHVVTAAHICGYDGGDEDSPICGAPPPTTSSASPNPT